MNRLYFNDELQHHGILGQKWGVRRYQNYDGTYTKAGMARYNKAVESGDKKAIKEAKKNLENSYRYDKGKEMSKSDPDEVGVSKKKWGTAAAGAAYLGLGQAAARELEKSNVIWNTSQKIAEKQAGPLKRSSKWDEVDKLSDYFDKVAKHPPTTDEGWQQLTEDKYEYAELVKDAMYDDNLNAIARQKQFRRKEVNKGAAVLAGVLAAGAATALVVGMKENAAYKEGESFMKAYSDGPTPEMRRTLTEYTIDKKKESKRLENTKNDLSKAIDRYKQ